jgi:NADH/NAD ratio-sensing transcriptional regulator Rex
VSQKLANRVASAGVKATWKFTPARLTLFDGVFVRSEHISVGLSQIAHQLKRCQDEGSGDLEQSDVRACCVTPP